MFKFVNGDVLESIKDMFSINKEIHDHFTRQSNKLVFPNVIEQLYRQMFLLWV